MKEKTILQQFVNSLMYLTIKFKISRQHLWTNMTLVG